jgi:hypothetical protein
MTKIKTYTLQEVYDSPVWYVDEGGNIYNIMDALNFHGSYDIDNQYRVKVKSHGHEISHASIQSVWLDDKPVMVICTYYPYEDSYPNIDTYVSDVSMYLQLMNYLMSFMSIPHSVVDVSKPVLDQVGHIEAQEILEGYSLCVIPTL